MCVNDSLTIFAAKLLEIYTPELEILENIVEQIERLCVKIVHIQQIEELLSCYYEE